MDKFVIKTPRGQQPSVKLEGDRPKNQATLESLKGVVNIDVILSYKQAFESPDTDRDVLIAHFSDLENKQPSKEILQSTGIGKAVHKLCKHQDAEVSSMAKSVYERWKRYVIKKHTQPIIEVKCDLKTEKLRNSARNMFVNVLHSEQDAETFAEDIERCVFLKCKKILNVRYRRTIRCIVFALKAESNRTKLTSKGISVTDLVDQYCKTGF